MAGKTVKDWMEAALLTEDPSHDEEFIIRDIAGSLDSGTLSLADILTQLRPYVDADQENLVTVSRGMTFLSAVLDCMHAETIPRLEVHALVLYFCSRIQNHESISNYGYALDSVANALRVIVKWKRFSPGDTSPVVEAVFSLVQGKTNRFTDQKPNTRLGYYLLISDLTTNPTLKRALERDMGPSKFASGLVELAESEKSASSLKTLFMLYASVSETWNLGPAEYSDIWGSFIRYFPITLGAQARNSDLPQPEELRKLLLKCIISNDAYAKEAFPSFLRDLDTDQAATKKKELLTTIYNCVTSYSATTVLEWASKIWDSVKFEVWNGENDEFIDDSLKIINGLISTLSNSPGESGVSKFVVELAKEVFDRLSDMKQYVVPSARILYAVGSASEYALQIIVENIIPRLDVMAQDQSSDISKTSLVLVLNHILQARLDLANDSATFQSKSDDNNLIQAQQKLEKDLTASFSLFRQSLVDIYFDALSELNAGPETDISLASAAIQGVSILTKIPDFLSVAEKGAIIDAFNSAVAQKTSTDELYKPILAAIGEISRSDPQGFRDTTLPRFMTQLPGMLSVEGDTRATEIESVVSLLEEIVQVSCTSTSTRGVQGRKSTDDTGCSQQNHDEMQKALSAKLNSVLEHKGQLEYANALLAASFRGLEVFDHSLRQTSTSKSGDVKPTSYSHNILPFIRCVVKVKEHDGGAIGTRTYIGLQSLGDNTEAFNDRSIELVGKMIMLSMVSSSLQKVDNILTTYDSTRPATEVPGIVSLFAPGVTDQSLCASQFDLSAGPPDKCLSTFLSVSLLAGMDRTNQDRAKSDIEIGNVAAAMLRNATNPHIKCSQLSRMSMLWFLQLLVNKFGVSKQMPSTEKGTVAQMMLDLVSNCAGKSDLEISLTYRTLAYFAAASLAAYNESVTSLLDCMITGITDSVHGRKVAQSFRILLAPSDILNKNNFCIIRPLRKGRLFDIGAKRIIELWRSETNKDIKDNCLVALSGILAYMEPTMLKDHVDLIFPPILEGTNIQNDEWSKATFIHTIHALVPLCPTVIEAHLDSVIGRMTGRTRNTPDAPSDGSPRCRVTALEVLTLLTEYIRPALLEQRRFKLMSELNFALNDSSREVRHKAEICKMAWFNLA